MGLAWSNQQQGDTIQAEIQEIGPDIVTNETTLQTEQNNEETDDERKQRKQEELSKFKEDLAIKREWGKKKLEEFTNNMNSLKEQLEREVAHRRELEEQLRRLNSGKSDLEPTRTPAQQGTKISEALRVSKYDEDDEDEIDILDEEDDESKPSAQEVLVIVKPPKKKVSFSLDLVQKEEFDPEAPSDSKIEIAEEATGESDEASSESGNVEEPTERSEFEQIQDLLAKNKKLENQIKALKDVASLSKQLLTMREAQVEELNGRMVRVEEKEKDYEKKMSAMKELRRLYDERNRAIIVDFKNQLELGKTKISMAESKLRMSETINEDLTEKNKHYGEKVKNLVNQLDEARNEISETKIKLATEKESHYHAASQISLINNLVSQVISGPELDLDHLARFLEENHALITELTAKGDIDYVASALVGVAGGIVEMPKEEKSDIAENLGKVWRVLTELLSHHKKTENGNTQEWESCYKSVDTPKGPKLVISVSQTFIKLKDLILEKNSLVKEVGRLKKLNEHLETRMVDQESRLTLVTEELHNTWDVVNKLKRQHDSLHTHERILKHELQHKRSMLNGLKKQLEICREQWTLAREKNSKTENDWMLLRKEFAMRKKKKLFNSAESGYEDEETQSPEYDTDDDKSLEIEEESPDNSVGENRRGSASPEVSTSESNDECNGPISEILDGIFDEAYQIVKSSNNTDKNDVLSADPNQIDTSFDISATERNQMINEFTNKRLEQIPEVEEESNDKIENNSLLVQTIQPPRADSKPDEKQIETSDRKKVIKDEIDKVQLTLVTNLEQDIRQEIVETTLHDDHQTNVKDTKQDIQQECIIGTAKQSIQQENVTDTMMQSIQQESVTGATQQDVQQETVTGAKQQDIQQKNVTGTPIQSIQQKNETDTIKQSIQQESVTGATQQVIQQETVTSAAQQDKSSTSPQESGTATRSETGSLTTDEILRRRDERLKRMEESCKSLFAKMGQTSNRGNEISNKLDQIHAIFGPQSTAQSNSDEAASQTPKSEIQPGIDEASDAANQPENSG